MGEPELIEYTYDRLVHATDDAWLLEMDGTEIWFPKSQCEKTSASTILVPEWMAIDKGLE